MSNVDKSERKRASARYLISWHFYESSKPAGTKGPDNGTAKFAAVREPCTVGSMARVINVSVGAVLRDILYSRQSIILSYELSRLSQFIDPQNIVQVLMTKDERMLWSFLREFGFTDLQYICTFHEPLSKQGLCLFSYLVSITLESVDYKWSRRFVRLLF